MKRTGFLLAASWAAAWGCSRKDPAPAASPPPARVASPADESSLAGVTLAQEAETRLGIATAPVEKRKVDRTLSLGGEVLIPPGRSVMLTAPFAGRLGVPGGGVPPAAGATVKKGQALFSLEPLLAPADRLQLARAVADLKASRVGAEGEVEAARVEHEAAKVALARAQVLLRDKAGSARNVDDATARLALAKARLEAAEARRDFLGKLSFDEDAGSGQALSIESPLDGFLLAVGAAPGGTVSPGAILVEVARDYLLWVRVPVQAGDFPQVDRAREALVGPLATAVEASPRKARPALAPPAGDPRSATVDVFYELENDAGRTLRPGERLGVTVFLSGEEDSLVVPWPAVVLDIHGGAWVYESLGKGRYQRRRVEVRVVSGDSAVLHSGPKPGTLVVTAGVAELFGTELGFSK